MISHAVSSMYRQVSIRRIAYGKRRLDGVCGAGGRLKRQATNNYMIQGEKMHAQEAGEGVGLVGAGLPTESTRGNGKLSGSIAGWLSVSGT